MNARSAVRNSSASRDQLPTIYAAVDRDEMGLIHLVMAEVARATSGAIGQQDWDQVRLHFSFMEGALSKANDDVANALQVSYLENILRGEEDAHHLRAKSLLPENLKKSFEELVEHFELLSRLQAERLKTSD